MNSAEVISDNTCYGEATNTRTASLTLSITCYITTHSQTPIFCIVSRVDKRYI